MTTLTLDHPLEASPRPSLLDRLIEERNAPRTRRERSLDERVSTTWTALSAGESPACLVCGAATEPRYGAGPRPVASRCTDCGSELS